MAGMQSLAACLPAKFIELSVCLTADCLFVCLFVESNVVVDSAAAHTIAEAANWRTGQRVAFSLTFFLLPDSETQPNSGRQVFVNENVRIIHESRLPERSPSQCWHQ